MLTFTLVISCLTTSSLPWFMDLIFEVPMQYCSLQHWTLLPSPVPSTTGRWFCFGSISSFVEGNGTPLQYSCLENPMDRGAWWAAVHEVTKSRTWLSYFTFTSHSHALEKEMTTHSSVLAWRIPGTAEPGGLLSMGSPRVGHNWCDLAAAAAASLHSFWSSFSTDLQ